MGTLAIPSSTYNTTNVGRKDKRGQDESESDRWTRKRAGHGNIAL